MELKAFEKIYDEAEEAIAEQRFYDALSLTEAILQDTDYTQALQEITGLRSTYSNLLQSISTLEREERDEAVNQLYREAIELLQMSRDFWHLSHPETEYGRIAAKLQDLDDDDLLEQLNHHLNRSFLGEDAYHEALDAAFGMCWILHVEPYAIPPLTKALQKSDNFARQTLVSAFLLGLLEQFTPEKLKLLLALGKPPKTDSEKDATDLQARVAVALTIIYRRYQSFFTFYTEEAALIRKYMRSKTIRPLLPTMLHAFTCQTLTDRVGKRIDDIMPIIRQAFEQQQPNLGSNDDEETGTEKKKERFSLEIKEIHLDESTKDNLFEKLSDHAHKLEEMRHEGLDVNFNSFTSMKSFDFFKHQAHWFYPFNLDVPVAKKGLTLANGKLDRMTLTIMEQNRFCSSDRYSYACMMSYLRKNGSSLTDILNEHTEDIDDTIRELNEELGEQTPPLNPFTDYMQCLHRYFLHDQTSSAPTSPFSSNHRQLYPLLPLFEGLFTDDAAFRTCISTLMYMGAFEQAIVLVNYVSEHYGTDAELLSVRGTAFMQLQQWQHALSAFQQELLINENPETELNMARCFEAIKQWDKALPLLMNEEQRIGDDNDVYSANIIEETGRCLIQLQRWDEAVQRFFRLEFMGRHLNVARRAIAWCSIHQGKYERAANYYQQLIDLQKATWEDHLNHGHTLWLQGLNGQAIAAYRTSQAAFNSSKETHRQHFRLWSEAFHEDAIGFLSEHFDTTDCALMLDAVTAQ